MVAEKKGQRDTRRVENASVSVILRYCCHPHTEYRIRHARRLVSHKLRANISSAIECLALAEATGACNGTHPKIVDLSKHNQHLRPARPRKKK